MAYLVYRDTNATFLRAKDTVTTATPVDLITVHISDLNATLYYCNNPDYNSITYYKPGTSVQQVYTPLPFSIGELKNNIEGRIDGVTITVSNIDRLFGGYLHSYDGLRNCKVNLLKVFKGSLNDPNANIREIYYIDSAQLTNKEVSFNLTSKFEVQKVTLPFRTFRRDQCQHSFGSDECNPNDVNATVSGKAGCSKTIASCDSYDNIRRFGGFPSIPIRRIIR